MLLYIGAAITGITAAALQEDAQAFSRTLAKKGIRWKAHDMRMAGLNPILAVRGGMGGGVPSGPGIASTAGMASAGAQEIEAVTKAGIAWYQKNILKAQASTAASTAVSAQSQATRDSISEEFFKTKDGKDAIAMR